MSNQSPTNIPKQSYFLNVYYEYEGERAAMDIMSTVTDNFFLPCWIQKISTSTKPYANRSQRRHPSNTANFATDLREANENILFNILDVRTFGWFGEKEKYNFVMTDRNQLAQLGEYCYNYDQQTLKHSQNSEEISNYIKQVDILIQSWKKIRLILNQKNEQKNTFKFYQNKSQFKVTLCQRRQKQYRVLYFLIKFAKQKQLRKLQKGTYLYEQQVLIVNLQSKSHCQIPVSITFSLGLQTKPQYRLKYYKIPQNKDVKVLKMIIKLDRCDFHFNQHLHLIYRKKESIIQDYHGLYYNIQPIISRNRIIFPYQEPKFSRNKINLMKHFHLAFQGGGGKGMAYVGADQAIKNQLQMSLEGKKEPIPITSIIGSSAGGVTALAVLIGFPNYLLQKICYKMNQIPSKDKYLSSQNQDEAHEQELLMAQLIDSLKRILSQYGIVQKQLFENIQKYLKSQEFEVIEEKLLKYLQIVSPTIATLLKCEGEPYPIDQSTGMFSKIRSWFKGRGHSTKKRLKINTLGLFLKGALMTGQSIHDLAGECLVKFMMKQRVQNQTQENFLGFLKNSLQDDKQQSAKVKSEKISNQLRNHRKNSQLLLNLQIKQVWKLFGRNEDHLFQKFIIGIVNQFIILIDNYLKINNPSQGLILESQQNDNKVDMQFLPLRFKEESIFSVVQYFMKNYCEQKENLIRQKYLSSCGQGQDNLMYQQKMKEYEYIKEHKFNCIYKRQNQNLSIGYINSILETANLINPIHLDTDLFMQKIIGNYQSEGNETESTHNVTIIELLNKIFGKQLLDVLNNLSQDKIVNQNNLKHQTQTYFYSLQIANSVFEVYQKLRDSYNGPTIQQAEQYEMEFKILREEVSTITMLEFYRMTKAEMSCTSVDLDNKVLRFFNHKTTPRLPVCKAVQMTGSFPVAFKAQRWKKEWGYYHVHHTDQKILIDIQGHEFTDGGLLANFPIKYMDNDNMRKIYFSHKAVQQLTILLGFGLDYLEPSRYELSEKQINTEKQNRQKQMIALTDLINSISKVKIFLSTFISTSSSSGETVKWSEISHYLINQIPILKFGLKLIDAYPNSDRNLNLQAFESKILVQTLAAPWKESSNYWNVQLTEHKCQIKQLVYEQCKLRQNSITQPFTNLSQNEKNQLHNKIRTSLQQFSVEINNRKNQIVDRIKLIKENYTNILQWNFQNIKLRKQRNSHLLLRRTSSHFEIDEQSAMERQLSLKLINIWLLHLKMKENRHIAEQYSRYYAFMKYVAKEPTSHFQDLPQRIETYEPLHIQKYLNKLNFSSLFQEKELEQISYHHDFQNYESDFYKGYIQKQKDMQNQKRTFGNKLNNAFSFFTKNQSNWEKSLRQNIEKQRQNSAFLKQYKSQYRQQGIKKMSQKFKNVSFCNMKVFDVTDSLRRLTQFLYLFIKGRNNSGLQHHKYINLLETIVKKVNFEQLLEQNNNQQNFTKQISQFQRLSNIIQINEANHNNFTLTFRQILNFVKTEIGFYSTKRVYKFEEKLTSFVDLYGMSQKKDEVASRIFRKYLCDLLYIPFHQRIDTQRVEQLNLKWKQRQFDFVFRLENQIHLLQILKNEIRLNREQFSKLLFEIIYNRQIILNDQFNFIGTFQEKRKQKIKIATVKELTQINQLLGFIVSLQSAGYNLSNEQQRSLNRRKNHLLQSILGFVLFNRKLTIQMIRNFSLFEQSNSKILRVKEQEFLQDIQQEKKRIQIQLRKADNCLQGLVNQYRSSIDFNQYNFIDQYLIKTVQLFTIRSYLNSKIENNPIKSQKDRFLMLNNNLFCDMEYFLFSIKEIILLLSTKQLTELKEKDQISDMILELFRHQQDNSKSKQLKPFSKNKSKSADRLDQNQLSQITQKVYKNIFEQYVINYQKIGATHRNLVDEATLTGAFIIKLKNIDQLIKSVCMPIRELLVQIQIKLKQQHAKMSQNTTKKYNILRYVDHIFSKLSRHKFSIPMLKIDWESCIYSTYHEYETKIKQIVYNQMLDHYDDFKSYLPLKKMQIERPMTPLCFKKHESIQSKGSVTSNQSTTENLKSRGIHLVFQGEGTSNEYIGSLMHNINQIMGNVRQKEGEQIKAITCANFHSVFGFLLSLGLKPQQIKLQMYKLRFAANVFEDESSIKRYFDNCAWINNSPQHYKDYLKYLEEENQNLFDRMQKLINKNYSQNCLKKEMNNIRQLYMYQKQAIMRTYERILDETAESMQAISHKYLPSQIPLQIAKKYAFNYSCSEGHKHQYAKLSKESADLFKIIIEKLITTFGSLLQGIICNGFIYSSSIRVRKQNAAHITKGFLMGRLLTTFKLKEYIINKLQQYRLSPSVSLNQFYNLSKRKIFLNFTVININQQRLTFLNKNTMPNMPLWAAIIATSHLPFLHQFFQANKEWEATNSASFYQFYIHQFFNASENKNNRFNLYTSANFISSLPLQLLTINTIRQKMFSNEPELSNLIQFAICFNRYQGNRLVDLDIDKKYLSLGISDLWKFGKHFVKNNGWSSIKNLFRSYKFHKNSQFNESFSMGDSLKSLLKQGSLMTTFNTLVESNDNFALQWYYNKLIRLPIKFDTLDFHQILDKANSQKYLVDLPSEKARQTIQRSYEITNTFIQNISERIQKEYVQQIQRNSETRRSNSPVRMSQRLLQTNLSTVSNRISDLNIISEEYENQIQQAHQQNNNKLQALIRVQIIEKLNKKSGFLRKYFKLIFLNHSKWNQNYVNNYVVQYFVDDKSLKETKNQKYIRASDSQILWHIELNSKIKLKFYYVLKFQKQNCQRYLQIYQTDFSLDFHSIVNKLPVNDSYDYRFTFGWQKDKHPNFYENFKHQKYQDLSPIKNNGFNFVKLDDEQQDQTMRLILLQQKEQNKQKFNDHDLIKKTAFVP